MKPSPLLNCLYPTVCCLSLALLACSSGVQAANWRVCPTDSADSDCTLRGYAGLQQAIDQSSDGDRILLAAGVYQPVAFHDVPYDELVIRGGALVENKTLQLVGEPSAILDGSAGPKVSALLLHNSKVRIQGLEIRDFKVDQAEDDLYEGHGVFIIDSEVTVQDTVLRRIPKMSLSVFGTSQVNARRIQVLEGHVGIWMEGTSRLRVENSLFSHNDSAAIAAYDQTHTEVYNSVIDSSLDDGIYGKEQATLRVGNTVLVNNQPYAVRVEEEASIAIDYSILHGNAALFFPDPPNPRLHKGEHILLLDPQLDTEYRITNPSLAEAGDPGIVNRDGSPASPGLDGGPNAESPVASY